MSLVEMYTPEEVAKATKLTAQTIREKCQCGEIRATKRAGKWLIYSDSFEQWLAAGEPEPIGVIHPMPSRRVAATGFKALVGGANG